MTLPPERIGDKGQRYEVTYLDGDGVRKTFGWSPDMEGARRFTRSIILHPTMSAPLIEDRSEREYVEPWAL